MQPRPGHVQGGIPKQHMVGTAFAFPIDLLLTPFIPPCSSAIQLISRHMMRDKESRVTHEKQTRS